MTLPLNYLFCLQHALQRSKRKSLWAKQLFVLDLDARTSESQRAVTGQEDV